MEFKILGPLEVRRDGRVLPCKGTKQRQLLAALLLHRNEVVSSDRLIEALWGAHPPPTAAKALQMHVSQVRRLLEPERELVLTQPPGYELRLEPGQLDLDRFELAVAGAQAAATSGRTEDAAVMYADALSLWRGAPLADLSYEEFLQPEIARLEELRLAAVEDRIDAELALGHHGELVAQLERLAGEHPLRERLRGQLMLALYRTGRQAEALEVYRDTRRALVDELGIEPTRQLKELERRILEQDAELDARPTAPASTPGAPGERLVGRERELAAALPVVDRALARDGAVILIGGEPGIGKSRLAEALAAHCDRHGGRVAVGRCWEAGGAPSYWPWVQALRVYLRDTAPDALPALIGRDAPVLATILPELRELVPDLPERAAADSPGARFQLFDAIAGFLRRAAIAAPLAVFLDDLHAADAGSLLLLRFAATQLVGARVVVVGCYRDTEISPELAEALAELARAPAVHGVALGGLVEADTAHLLQAVTGEPAADELITRIHSETQGNPLFVGEVARLLASDAAADAPARLPLPDGVREAIRQRLRRRSDDCRAVLTLASVLGREFDLVTLEAVAALPESALIAVLDEAAASRLIGDVPGTSGRLRFAHMLIRDAVYEDLTRATRMRLHRDVGEALERIYAGNRAPHLAELAHHFVAAGGATVDKAIDYSVLAAEHAAVQHAYEEAARLYAIALEELDRSAGADRQRRCQVLVSRGEALSRAGRGAEAKAALRQAAEIAEQQGFSDLLARAALAYGGRFAWPRSSIDAGFLPLLERALAATGMSDRSTRARLLARLAAARRDDPAGAVRRRLAAEAVELARRGDDPVTLAYALEGYGSAADGKDPRDALGVAEELIAIGERLGDKERAWTGHDFRLTRVWRLADRAGVDVELEAMARLADELRQPGHRWLLATWRTALALTEGRLADAERLISERRDEGERAESWNAGVSERLALFVLRRAQGRLPELADAIARSVHEYPTLLRFRCALAHLHAELGDVQGARGVASELLSRDLANDYVDAEWAFAINLLPDVCRFLADQDAAAQVYSLLLPCERLYAVAPIEAPFGSVARGLGVAATVLRRFDDAERHFEAALEIERRMRALPWHAHAKHDFGLMLLARDADGDRERGARLLADASATYRSLGMAPWSLRAEAQLP